MSLFPGSPTNGQTTVVNGITYTYNSSQTAWIRTSIPIPPLIQGPVGIQGIQGIQGVQGVQAAIVPYIFEGGSPTSTYSVGPAFDCGGVT